MSTLRALLACAGLLAALDCGGGGNAGPGGAPLIRAFEASPRAILAGQPSTLRWSVENATSLSIDPAIGAVTGEGLSVMPARSTTYTLTARNAAGASTATATLTLAPPSLTVSLGNVSATPDAIAPGRTSTLNWTASDAVSVTLDPGFEVVTDRTSLVVAPGATTTYTLTATDATGAIQTASVRVVVDGAPLAATPSPLLFTTQVPFPNLPGTRMSAFANHLADIGSVPRGGDLLLRDSDGTLRNLTQEAGFGMEGRQGATAIAVREPSVHWDGTKALFSMVVGAPASQADRPAAFWQIYEVTGLQKGQRARITKVPGQPAGANNISPFYGSDDRVLFTSDRPRGGEAHLYPLLDEALGAPAVSGIWRLDPATGELHLLNHAPSGAFSPCLDSFGRILFTRWDHLQRDALAGADADAESKGLPAPNGTFNYADEGAGATALLMRTEVYPEALGGETGGPYGPLNPRGADFFAPWQMNEDGSAEETLNHVGAHELSFGPLQTSFAADPALSYATDDALHANRFAIAEHGGLFQMREDPAAPGTYVGVEARAFGPYASDHLVRLVGAPGLSAEGMTVTEVTPGSATSSAGLPGGRYRNPLPLSDGSLLASHTTYGQAPKYLGTDTIHDFLLKRLLPDPSGALKLDPRSLTGGIHKSLSWWTPEGLQTFDGILWELDPVEVRPRPRPQGAAPALEAPERAVFQEAGVDEAAFRTWLAERGLALIVTRDQTSRDRADLNQPFNLRVVGGTAQTLSPRGGRIYDLAHFQIFQADLIRGSKRPGRRALAQPLHDPAALNPANPDGPSGSVKIAPDGSTAALVPARRALTWQTTDADGVGIVRERKWVTFQPGEIRTCASCHGLNTQNQAGLPTPQNKPQALRNFLDFWKGLPRSASK